MDSHANNLVMPGNSHLQQSRAALTLAALGVVYGDIGTSPLYAVKETFNPAHGIAPLPENILGGISAIFWALMVVVSLKYVILIMRANNKGEGGIMALLALALSSVKKTGRSSAPILLVGLFGASLFYGDAVLTPAISVLSAVEGIEVGTKVLKPYVLPISVGVLIALFLFQRHGTATIGALFGPITVLWFLALAAAGIYGIVQHPAVLGALNPLHAFGFVTQHGFASFAVLGAVLLAFTGAEALYADMGHFGSGPIRLAWFGLVFPALMLNYLGQGALLIVNAKAIENPFYLLFPSWALYPMVALATAATVIASQATISGAYSLTKQAIQLGYLPRMNVVQTSEKAIGQIYIPSLNGILLVAVLVAVLGFGSSSNLASAYGVAVTGTMVATTLLTFFVIHYGWGYNLLLSIFATGFFIAVDVAFLSSSLLKVAEGGWFPLIVGAGMFIVMMTWLRGRQVLMAALRSSDLQLKTFLDSLFRAPPPRVQGTAVFLTATPDVVPHALMHNLNHNKVLHERVLFLTVTMKDVPWVPLSECASVESLGHDCYRITLRFGFMDQPDVSQALNAQLRESGLAFDMMDTSFFLSRETIIPVATVSSGMAPWREGLFATMSRNASNAADYFNIPANRVIEIGTQIQI
ncbi:putative potassium transport system protein kup 2 [Cupriavidus oxalaticus]|uniref:Probable potassium transport system protein Kup n=2 Tax=Cupriavidus oxalaticus TaxID=96344 RepID=A0A375FRG5_9BURK|nr:putative potassium transport system protein kup 2 [Cupriavidus oxalaticus]SPC12340.1 putative potassium transport system protein kup 2 [Cupriavidus oxalaticus]